MGVCTWRNGISFKLTEESLEYTLTIHNNKLHKSVDSYPSKRKSNKFIYKTLDRNFRVVNQSDFN